MKFAWLDDWYGAAYDQQMETGGPWLHGTADFWDVALRGAGHESETFLQNGCDAVDAAVRFGQDGGPVDVVVVQNVGRWMPHYLRPRFPAGTKFVAFCSYSAHRENLTGWDAVFTSFPWLADEMNAAGLRTVHLPLAFGRQVLDRVPYSGPRDIPVAFVGGLGMRVWERGTMAIARVCGAIPEFKWWGYYHGDPRDYPAAIQERYQGPAWGADYWNILQRTSILINRHGEIAKGTPRQNMREFEGPGCGCFLLSDTTPQRPGVAQYHSADDAVNLIRDLLDERNRAALELEALESQQNILENHCYEHRVPKFLEVINSL
jgi:hypothetical protein